MTPIINSDHDDFADYWQQLYANDPLQNPLYGRRRKVQRNSHGEYRDHSFLVLYQGQPIFGCSMTETVDEAGSRHIGYYGLEASPHSNRKGLSVGSNNFERDPVVRLQQHFAELYDSINPDSMDYLDPVSCGMMSPVTQVLLERGACPVIQAAQFIDLTQSIPVLYRNLSKRQRGLIQWGRQNLTMAIVPGACDFPSLCSNAFLRAQVSHTYLCESAIKLGNAFQVQGYFKGELAALALFTFTDKCCHFLAGGSLSTAPDRPALHSLIWQAILHARQLGCEEFDLGSAPNGKDVQPDKLLGGFGSTLRTQLKITLD